MIMTRLSLLLLLLCAATLQAQTDAPLPQETRAQYDARMAWWAEARFGLFIHWGLYAVPAGEWDGKTGYGEWIRTSAEIPIDTYDRFRAQFHPTRFDAEAWVRMAKAAGMKYITITTKHHDGFCLFGSDETDFDILSTPFGRDVMAELAAACKREGIRLCWYYSIMDWHHPDYLPRRNWERDRPTAGADPARYLRYMKAQLRELLTKYGPIGVLWFDGEWEQSWTHERGRDLYAYVRSLQPDIIVNNRVGAGRSGMEGFSEDANDAGDFGTPEQQIPATGLPGVYWETCMTMNDHWGYNRHDRAWKSSAELLRMLADIASKGGNYLLNIGPTAAGEFPPESVERLRDIGAWMRVNGESIYGTMASPFARLAWGRCTQKRTETGTRLYLHVFDWPADGQLVVRGIYGLPRAATLLADPAKAPLALSRREDALVIAVPRNAPDTINTVVALDFDGTPDISDPPTVAATRPMFIDTLYVTLASPRAGVELRYTLDGTVPTSASPRYTAPLLLRETAKVNARCFRDGRAVSEETAAQFRKVTPLPPHAPHRSLPGLRARCYRGSWERVPDFAALAAASDTTAARVSLAPRCSEDKFALAFDGYLSAPVTGVYAFHLTSDDGSLLLIDDSLVVDNDQLHAAVERTGLVALSAGLHTIAVRFFEQTGGDELKLAWTVPGEKKVFVPDSVLFRDAGH
jgi:alpha-L-fucosidase